MKVVHLETGRHLYGGARQVLYLLDGLREGDVENVLVCGEGSAVSRAAANRCVTLPIRGDLDAVFGWRFRRLLDAERPDIVHLHSRRGADVLGGLAARAAHCKVVLSRRVDHPEPRLLVPIKYRLFDKVIAISEAIRSVLEERGVPRKKLVCVRSAIEAQSTAAGDRMRLRAELGLDAKQPLIGAVGQLIPRKGHDVLLEALPAVRRSRPGLVAVIFGAGPREAALRAQTRALGIEDDVIFLGFRDDLTALLPALDVLVHPARAEGLGVALLQAAAAGVPIVASAVGGIPEVVRHGETGLLVSPDDPLALSEAVIRLLADPPLARAMSRRGRELVETEFSVPRMVAGNLAVYRALIGDNAAGAEPESATGAPVQ
ncbi:glycosyltransferase family 4 protein [soil metagenome]